MLETGGHRPCVPGEKEMGNYRAEGKLTEGRDFEVPLEI